MHRVLIITDDQRMAAALAGALAGANVVTTVAASDLDGIEEALSRGGPAAVVLDTRTGPPLARALPALRQHPGFDEIPVIAILPKAAIESLPVPQLDDFLFDPPPVRELAVRVMMRLTVAEALESGNTVRAGAIEVDIDNYRARLDGTLLELTYKEFELLRFLVTHRGRVFTREALLNRVWGYDYFGGARTVDVHIRRLRAKLGTYEDRIETVRNVGYRFSDEG